MDLISVIIPVYKVEKYLDRCMESVVNQTYKELEIILVDDGSPDNCSAMCDEWAKKDERIKVIHKQNGGGAQARNVGIDASTGNYIAFVDSDDVIHREMYEILYSVLKKYDCDIVECDYTKDGDFEEIISEEPELYDNTEGMKQYLEGKSCVQLIWNKLYRRETVGGVRFVSGKLIDDEFFTYRVFGNSKKTAVINPKLYFYRQQEDSVMHREYSLKRLAAVEAKIELAKYIKEKYPELFYKANQLTAGSCIYNGQMSLKYLSEGDRKAAFEFLKKTFKSCNIKRKDLNGMIFKHRAWYYVAGFSLPLCCKLRNILNIGF